jgi:hypothetical protein
VVVGALLAQTEGGILEGICGWESIEEDDRKSLKCGAECLLLFTLPGNEAELLF